MNPKPTTMKATMATTIDNGEPVFEFGKVADLHGINGDKPGRDTHNPDPLRNRWEPHGTVDGDRRHFGTDGNDLDKDVGRANGKARPLVEVGLRVDAEGTGYWMNDGHLSDGISNDNRDNGAENIRQDDAGASQSDRQGTTEEESHPDRTTDRHHGKLALREPALELERALGRVRQGRCGSHRSATRSASFTYSEPSHGVPSRTRESPRWCCSGELMRG